MTAIKAKAPHVSRPEGKKHQDMRFRMIRRDARVCRRSKGWSRTAFSNKRSYKRNEDPDRCCSFLNVTTRYADYRCKTRKPIPRDDRYHARAAVDRAEPIQIVAGPNSGMQPGRGPVAYTCSRLARPMPRRDNHDSSDRLRHLRKLSRCTCMEVKKQDLQL